MELFVIDTSKMYFLLRVTFILGIGLVRSDIPGDTIKRPKVVKQSPEWVMQCSKKNLTINTCICPYLSDAKEKIENFCGKKSIKEITTNRPETTSLESQTTTTPTTKRTTTTLTNLTNLPVASNLTSDTFSGICKELNIHIHMRGHCTCEIIEKYQQKCKQINFITETNTAIRKHCTASNVSDNKCYCETLYHRSKDYAEECGKPRRRGVVVFPTDLNKLCIALNISKVNCSCSQMGVENPPLELFCKYISKSKAPIISKCNLDSRTRVQSAFTIVACVFGVLGNLLVLIVRSRQWKDSIHYKLISGLALADFMFSILQIIYSVPKLIIGCKWPYGLGMCKILHSFLSLSYSVDLGLIVIIAIERYAAIVHPLSDFLTDNRVYGMVGVNLFFSVLGVLPVLIVLTIDTRGRCLEEWDGFPFSSLTYSWILLTVYFLVPVVITTVLYRSSMCALKRSLERRMSAVHGKSRSRLAVENRRILFVLSLLLVALVILVSPNRVIWLVLDYIGVNNVNRDTYYTLKILAVVPYSLHIMVNPIIYSLVDKRFRTNAVFLIKYIRLRSTLTTMTHSTSATTGFPLTERALNYQHQMDGNAYDGKTSLARPNCNHYNNCNIYEKVT